ncbi:BTB/POZ domain-containing protein 6 [Aphelenchoides avenae]|nr:BTB/POZ domain-containing protein 6 [Aphelenchus avenae]
MNLADRMQRLLLDEKLQDVTFVVGRDQQKFRANSYVLAAASEVFYGMFFSDFEREAVVKVPDGTPQAFKVLLEYIHTDEVKLTLENVDDVLYLAKKYMVDSLNEKVSSFVKENLNGSNVFNFLVVSKVYEEYEKICLDFIDENAEKVLTSNNFLELEEGHLKAILSRDSLKATETVVWGCTVDWAKAKLLSRHEEQSPEAIRKSLGDLLYLVRFPLMSIEMFGQGPGRSCILTQDERLEVYEWFAIQKAPALFVTRQRRSPRSDFANNGFPSASTGRFACNDGFARGLRPQNAGTPLPYFPY